MRVLCSKAELFSVQFMSQQTLGITCKYYWGSISCLQMIKRFHSQLHMTLQRAIICVPQPATSKPGWRGLRLRSVWSARSESRAEQQQICSEIEKIKYGSNGKQLSNSKAIFTECPNPFCGHTHQSLTSQIVSELLIWCFLHLARFIINTWYGNI